MLKVFIPLMLTLFVLTECSKAQNSTLTIHAYEDALVNSAQPNTNYGSMIDWATWDWATYGISRSFMKIDLSSIPSGAIIVNAKINLYHNLNTGNSGHYGNNASYLQRITSSWNEFNVNWNNQPTTSTINQVGLTQSTSTFQNYLNVDITALITDIWNNPSTSHGIAIRLQAEGSYRSMKFTAREFTDSTKHTWIEITYTMPFQINVSASPVSCHGLCDGSATVNVNAGTPPYTYLWSNNATTQSIQNLCPGTYTVTVSGSQGSKIDSVVISQPSKLLVNGSGPHSICPGQSTNISAVASGGTPPLFYYWSHSLGMGPSKTVSPAATTDYYVYALDLNGCTSDPDTVTVIVQAAQQAVIYGLVSSYCSNDSVQSLTGFPAGGVFSGTGISGQAFSPSLAGPGTHSISYTVSTACVAPAQASVIVFPAPAVSLSGLAAHYCTQSAAVTLSASPAGGSFSGNGISGGVFNPLNAGPGNHTITYNYSDTNSCSANASLSTIVAQSPTANAGVDILIMSMTSATLMGSAIGGSGMYSYTWAPPDSFYFPNVQAPTTKPLAVTNTFTLTVTDLASSCQATDQMIVNVINSTALMVVASGNPAIACSGAPVQLSANATGGIGNYTYTWSSNPFGFSSSLANPIANPLISTTYTVTVSDGINTSVASVIINVSPPVYCNIYGLPQQLCTNSNPLTLQGSPAGGLFSGNAVSGGVFYPALAGAGVHKIYYQYTNSNACTAKDSASIAVLPPPVVSLSGIPMSLCNSDAPYTLVGAPAGGTFSGTGVTGNMFNPAGLNPGSHLLSYHYTDTSTLCNSSASVSITIKPSPAANAGADKSISCGGSGVQIGSSPLPTFNYFWSPALGLSNPLIANPLANPPHAMVYVLKVTDTQTQCSSNDTVVVSVNGVPSVSISSDTVICAGISVSLAAGGASHFIWSNGDTSSVIQVQPLQTTFYVVQVFNDTLCKGIDTVKVSVIQPKVVSLGNDTTISMDKSITLDAGSGFVSYLWSTGSTQQSIVVDGAVIGFGIHNLWVTAIDSNGCSSSDTLKLTIVTGMQSIADEKALRAYPNPFNTEILIELNDGVNQEPTAINLYDAGGRRMSVSTIMDGSKVRLITSDISNGLYILEVIMPQSSPHRALIVKQSTP